MALRGLTRRPVRTLLTSLGIAVAVASMVIFLSLGEGVRKVFAQELGGIGPDIQVSMTDLSQGFALHPNVPQDTVTKIEALSGELGIQSVTPVIMAVRGSFDPTKKAIMYGLPAVQGIQAVFPKAEIAQGRLLEPKDDRRQVAVLGAKAAEQLHLKIGSYLNLSRRDRVKVVGILKVQSGLSDNFMFIPLHNLQRSEGAVGRVSLVAVKLKQPKTADEVAQILSKRLDMEAQTQADFLSFIDRAMKISDAMRFGISLIALVVGGLAVVNTVMMSVFERTREFGTLRAMGARPSFVRALVLAESLLLSLVGGVVGLVLGMMGIWVVNQYTQNLASIDMALLTPRLALLALVISFVLGLVSGLLPAHNAGKVRIVDALGRV